jgi:formate dehydrogenase subunit gamma
MNGEALCNHAKASLKLGFGDTSADGQVTLDAVYCLGNCALSPAMMVDGHLHGRVDAKRFDEIMEETLREAAQ